MLHIVALASRQDNQLMASPFRQRLLDLATDIATTQPDEMTFSHSVLCQFREFF